MERNSEGKQTWIVIVMAIVGGLAAVGDSLLSAGLLDSWPVAVTIIGCVISAAVAVGAYSRSRGQKKAAEAMAAIPKAVPSKDPS